MDFIRILLVQIVLLFYFYFICITASSKGCGPSISTPGYTYPAGDIHLKEGEDLEILCIVNDASVAENANLELRFYMNDKPVDSEIVNSTTIRYYVKNHPKTRLTDYVCYLGGVFVCHNFVTVGTAPQNITDFDCIGKNYENFTCTWTQPENYILTSYDLENIIPKRYNKNHHKPKSSSKSKVTPTPGINAPSKCPMIENITTSTGTISSCTWALHTKPQYRHSQEDFTFKLYASNLFGNASWSFPIKHNTRVRPNPPEKFHAIEASSHSISLNWTVPSSMQVYSKGFNYRISWRIEENKNWVTKYHFSKDKNVIYQLTDLPYAHCLYDIRVSMKCAEAVDERMWSLNSSDTIRTLSKIPDCPPTTTAGSFEFLTGNENKLIYWQSIHYYQENGEDFVYYIKSDEDPSIEPVKIYSNYAKFANLPDKNYTFRIWSQNKKGKSFNSSSVFVPAQKYAIKPLEKLVKVFKGGGEYDLQWTKSEDPRVTNYTLFWCSTQRERPFICDGTLHWETVSKDVVNKTLNLRTFDSVKNQTINIYQFAISANGHGTSSGLLWAECTVIPGSGVKLKQTYVKRVTSRSIVLQYKVGCIKFGDIQKFEVSYCTVITASEAQECQPDSKRNKTFQNINEKSEGELTIENLKPYTTYRIQVRPIVNDTDSQFSEPMTNATYEDTPTEPRFLKVLQIYDRNISIEWEKPLEENGVLTQYVIKANDVEMKKIVPVKDKIVYNETITGLLPRTRYTITVEACTRTCNNSAVDISTEIGYPDKVPRPSANWDNYTLFLKWEKPGEPSVKVDYYQVEVSKESENKVADVSNVSDPKVNITLCHLHKEETLKVRVKAVNVKDDNVLNGEWSDMAEFPCQSQNSMSVAIPVIVFFTFIFGCAAFFFLRKCWGRFRGMRHVPVKLPPGLDAVVNNFEQKEKHSDEILPGEPLLPDNFASHPRNPSGETSGCCSGSESVSSSVESAGHLSMSDSGTEQPRSPEAESKDITLRQRPSVKKGDYLTMTEMSKGPWSNKVAEGSYSVVGVNSVQKVPDEESECTSLSDISASYLPFTTVEQPKTGASTSGYVPHSMQDAASKMKPAKTSKPTLQEEITRIVLDPTKPLPWQQAPTGYVVVGDSKPQDTDQGGQRPSNRSYVPHTLKFENQKSFKED